MRIINQEELAMLLHKTLYGLGEYRELTGRTQPAWEDEAEFNKDDCRAQAGRLLEQVRVAIKPEAE